MTENQNAQPRATLHGGVATAMALAGRVWLLRKFGEGVAAVRVYSRRLLRPHAETNPATVKRAPCSVIHFRARARGGRMKVLRCSAEIEVEFLVIVESEDVNRHELEEYAEEEISNCSPQMWVTEREVKDVKDLEILPDGWDDSCLVYGRTKKDITVAELKELMARRDEIEAHPNQMDLFKDWKEP
jgi:hypothetical protein